MDIDDDRQSIGSANSLLQWAGNNMMPSTSSSSSTLASSSLGHDLFNLALVAERARTTVTMPWERGFYAKVVGTNVSRPIPYCSPPHHPSHLFRLQTAPSLENPVTITTTKRARLGFAVRKLRSVDLEDVDDYLRFRGLNRWRVIIESDLEASVVGRQLSELVTDLHADAVICSTISDVFAKKSTATLLKRAASVFLFMAWSRNRIIERPLLFLESQVYDYVCFLRSSSAAPTVAITFTQAVNFCIHTCGFKNAAEASASQRIRGACSQQYRKKRPLKQAPALTVVGLQILENCCNESKVAFDIIDSGQMVFCGLSCSRWGDAQKPASMTCDLDSDFFGFVQLDTVEHKTSTTDEKKTMFLPLVAISPGFLRKPWTRAWLQARRAAGLKAGVGPMVPVPASNGLWTKRKLSSGEATMHMRELLVAGGMAPDEAARFSTHSLKASILSMACKWGMDIPTRRLLGHHVDKENSTLSYSRDALSIPLSRVIDMIGEITSGKFDPDTTRMQRAKLRQNAAAWKSCAANSVAEVIDPVGLKDQFEDSEGIEGLGSDDEGFGEAVITAKDLVAASSSSDSSSDGSGSDESLSEEDINTAAIEVADLTEIDGERLERPSPFGAEGEFDIMQHSVHGTMHVRTKLRPSHLLCGRMISSMYSIIRNRQTYQWPVCRVCLGKRPELDYLIPDSEAPPT